MKLARRMQEMRERMGRGGERGVRDGRGPRRGPPGEDGPPRGRRRPPRPEFEDGAEMAPANPENSV